ncbi:hypothetical protein AKJ41_02365 [candidate division MSBL1 archaeon SCGC-AAA259O05]|uniref:Uncharacterized protein n=1 Tax=candidate division MSBL1 archaeon SCGC-AAA259O05 TaxID=1698271 RepID=A0A133V450_9EURY|nr:hypothetical protein AKJ41_02365 [candidate division MSBL1 archaeon SCGC-AAA259O05]
MVATVLSSTPPRETTETSERFRREESSLQVTLTTLDSGFFFFNFLMADRTSVLSPDRDTDITTSGETGGSDSGETIISPAGTA